MLLVRHPMQTLANDDCRECILEGWPRTSFQVCMSGEWFSQAWRSLEWLHSAVAALPQAEGKGEGAVARMRTSRQTSAFAVQATITAPRIVDGSNARRVEGLGWTGAQVEASLEAAGET